jgi:hypothetical protein
VRHLLRTFFNDSMESAVVAMLGVAEKRPSDEELKRLPRASAARHFMWASALAGALRLALVGPVAPPVTLAVPPAAGAPCA